MSEKTEQPTAKRIRDAREEGQVAKSQEITSLIQLGIILLWMLSEGPILYSGMSGFIYAVIDILNVPLQSGLMILAGKLSDIWIRFVFGLAGLLAVTLTLTGLIQSGFLFAPKAIKPAAKRINPLSNAKQMFSLMKLFELAKMLLKVGVLGLTFAYLIERYAPSFAHLSQSELTAGMQVCSQMAQWMWAILLLVTAIFSAADYTMQYKQLRKQLMMSREDIKQEFKNSEGNPEVKNRRREIHREVQSGSLASKVKKSSLVVRNPTHIAVCLRYQEGETPLPQVMEYGRDNRAKQIVALAEANSIPVVENIPLARALIASTSPGDYIPEELFTVVAQILRIIRNERDVENEA